jgi:hypothetical protein
MGQSQEFVWTRQRYRVYEARLGRIVAARVKGIKDMESFGR